MAAFLWAAVLVVQIGSWSATHAVPLRDGELSISLAPDAKWHAVHVLVDNCACSRAVAEHLAHRGPQPGWIEEVWILNAASLIAVPNFPTTSLSPARAHASGLTGGPRLLLFSPAGVLVWSGGYTPRKPRGALELADLSTMRELASGHQPALVPVFGCPRAIPNPS